MNLLAYIVSVNSALFVTMLGLALGQFLLTLTTFRLDVRSEVKILRACLIGACTAPLLLPLLGNVVGTNFATLKISASDNTQIGAWLLWGVDFFNESLLFVVLVGCSAAGAISVLAFDIYRLQRLRLRCPVSRRHGAVHLRRASDGSPPCAFAHFGVANIIVPTGLEPDQERAVVLHELAHIRHGDLQWRWTVSLFSVLAAWNPMFWLWVACHTDRCEIACDQSVIARGKIGSNAYARILLALARSFSLAREARLQAAAAFFLGGPFTRKTALKRRILLLLEPTHEAGHLWIFRAILGAVVGANMTVVAAQVSVPSWSVISLEASTNANLARMRPRISPAYGLVLSY